MLLQIKSIGLGDGGSGGDPLGNGQNTNTFLAKMLRIDIDNGDPYSIPADNPFVNNPDVLDEIWAIGLRNPWRFSFDRQTGDLWIGDVGQNAHEEIDFEPANSGGGLNYGWRCYEGFSTFNTSGCGSASEYTEPAWDYANNNTVGRSVTGGYVYRGTEFPALLGRYIYADFVSGRIWSLTPDGNSGWTNVELLDWTNNQIGSFGEDMNGEIYLAALQSGRIYQLKSACSDLNLMPNFSPISCFGEADGSVEIADLSNDYTITWNTGETTFVIDNLMAGEYSATVTDAFGCTSETSQVLEEPAEINFELDLNGVAVIAPEGFASYEWYADGELIPDATIATYLLQSTESSFYVIVTDANGCTFISPTLYILNTNQIEGLSEFKISPNPFTNKINLSLKTDQVLDLNLQILNIEGKILKEEMLKVGAAFSKTIDLNKLPKGVYFLKLTHQQNTAVQRIVKQ